MSLKEKIEVCWENKEDIIFTKLKNLKKLPFQLVEFVKSNDYEIRDGNNELIRGNTSLVMNSLINNYEGMINLIYFYIPDMNDKKKYWTKKNSIIEDHLINKWNAQTEVNYISSLYIQFYLAKKLLSENGSIYVHVNKTNEYSHYVKIIMDEIFGIENFQRCIFWENPNSVDEDKHLEIVSDYIFYYSNTEKRKFNKQIAPRYRKDSNTGEIQIEEDVLEPRTDIFRDISLESDSIGEDYWDYKPIELIKIIIKASSNQGDLIADFNTPTGTSLIASEMLNRRWIGCINSKFSQTLIKNRLLNLSKLKPFKIYNLGKYERQLWKEPLYFSQEEIKKNYLKFILKLFNANRKKNTKFINGFKGEYLVFIADIDEVLSQSKVDLLKQEMESLEQNKLKILCWMKEKGVKNLNNDDKIIKIITLPEGLLNMKNDEEFFENAYIDTSLEKEGSYYKLVIRDFAIPIINDLIVLNFSEFNHWTDLIDYWTLDLDIEEHYSKDKNYYFRTNQNTELPLKSKSFKLSNSNIFILLKITDVIGNTSFKKIKVKEVK